ncbi:MAG: hypothetical protein QXT43_00735 [Candidatus Micrarchaeaceae archaeon]
MKAKRGGANRHVDSSALLNLELVLLFLLFVIGLTIAYLYAPLSEYEYVLFAAFGALFFAYAYAFAIRKSLKRLLHSLFALSVLTFAGVIYAAGAPFAILSGTIGILELFSIDLLVLLPAAFLIATGTYIYKKSKSAAMIVLIAALLLVLVYFATDLILKGFGFDDEMFIVVQSIKELEHGINPYGISFARLIYYNRTVFVPTVSTTNKILGTLQYPPLFLISFLPFYLLSGKSIESISAIGFTVSYTAYLFVLVLVTFLVKKRRDRLKPSVAFLSVVAISATVFSAVQDLLLIALLIIAYEKAESGYAWVFFGLCASLQELAWVPILLLVAYIALFKGMLAGVKQLGLSLLLFLAIGSWFIATKPQAFLLSLFEPLGKPIPSATSPFGFAILKTGVALNAYTTIFAAVLIISVLLLALHKEKKLIPLLSMLPFLFLDHSIVTYYTIFGTVFAYAVFMSSESKRAQRHSGLFFRSHAHILYAAIVLAIITAALAAFGAHSAYVRAFNISTSNATLSNVAIANNTTSTLREELSYSNLANSTVYMYFITKPAYGIASTVGFFNETIINSNTNISCESYACKINTNALVLKGKGSYELIASFTSKEALACVEPIIYSGNYWLFQKPVCENAEKA